MGTEPTPNSSWAVAMRGQSRWASASRRLSSWPQAASLTFTCGSHMCWRPGGGRGTGERSGVKGVRLNKWSTGRQGRSFISENLSGLLASQSEAGGLFEQITAGRLDTNLINSLECREMNFLFDLCKDLLRQWGSAGHRQTDTQTQRSYAFVVFNSH